MDSLIDFTEQICRMPKTFQVRREVHSRLVLELKAMMENPDFPSGIVRDREKLKHFIEAVEGIEEDSKIPNVLSELEAIRSGTVYNAEFHATVTSILALLNIAASKGYLKLAPLPSYSGSSRNGGKAVTQLHKCSKYVGSN